MKEDQELMKNLKEENEKLKSGFKWLLDCYKATLSGKPVKNLDEVILHAEILTKEN